MKTQTLAVTFAAFLGQTQNRIWNAMISPVAPYAVRGAIWYQGESNRGQPANLIDKNGWPVFAFASQAVDIQ